MKKGLLILTVAALGFAACSGGFKKGPAGLEYRIHNDVKGDSIKEGDFISLNIVAKTEADSSLFNSYEMGRPSEAYFPKPVYAGDIFYALKMLTKGDSATIKINLDSAVAKGQPRPAGIKGKYLIYTVKVEEVIHKDTAHMKDFQAKVEKYFKAEGERAKTGEVTKLQKYIDDNKLKTTKLPSGLQVVNTIEGKGEQPVAGDSVLVNYTGKILSGKVFDTSLEDVAKKNNMYNPQRAPYAPLSVVLGKGGIIPGFEQGILQMKKGGKAIVLIPSNLAYGEQGMPGGLIGPFTPLIFELELVNVFHNPKAAPATAPVMLPAAPVK
jgi:FKBP-type peptidyl-prolyl cis-trans isomerase FkpA